MASGETFNISIDKTAAQVSMVCGSIIVTKLIWSNLYNGMAKMKTGNRPPEDQGFAPKDAPKMNFGESSSVPKEKADIEERAARVTQNDLENIPVGLFAITASLFFGKSTDLHIYAVATYTISRVLHTTTYLYGKAGPRMLFYFTGFLSTFALLGNACYGVLM